MVPGVSFEVRKVYWGHLDLRSVSLTERAWREYIGSVPLVVQLFWRYVLSRTGA